MSTLTMYDAEYPVGIPAGAQVIAGYIGGDAGHVWTSGEWGKYTPFLRLPIWVRDNPQAWQPLTDASRCAAALRALGVPKGATVALDMEMTVDRPWVVQFATSILDAGWYTMLYGSKSTVLENGPTSGGFWTADWTGKPHLSVGATATQWTSGAHWDISEIDETHSRYLWGHNAGNPVPAPSKPQFGNRYSGFPTIRVGFSDPKPCSGLATSHCPVTSLQNALNIVSGAESARHSGHLVPDGVFGSQTGVRVDDFQRVFNLVQDGTVGPSTWAALNGALGHLGR